MGQRHTWLLDEQASKALNGANAYMLSHITGNNRHYEASADTTTFNLLLWIRARRLRWLGHILRLPDKRWKKTSKGKIMVQEERLIKKAIRHILEFRQYGDMLMDIEPNVSWTALVQMAQDRVEWKLRVRKMKRAAKAKSWCESTVNKKNLRKAIKATSAPTQPKSYFSFRAHCKLTTINTNKADKADKVSEKQRKAAINEFIAGTTEDRQALKDKRKN